MKVEIVSEILEQLTQVEIKMESIEDSIFTAEGAIRVSQYLKIQKRLISIEVRADRLRLKIEEKRVKHGG